MPVVRIHYTVYGGIKYRRTDSNQCDDMIEQPTVTPVQRVTQRIGKKNRVCKYKGPWRFEVEEK